jgi:hypothetical protein
MIDLYVINLKERNDRFENIKKNFSNYNIIQVDAIKHEKGAIGCFLSHKKCIQIAKEKNLKNIIVIEDDCVPTNNFDRIINIKKFLDENDNWDIFLGGAFHVNPYHILGKVNMQVDNLLSINGGYCFHFIIYNNTCYDFFLNQDENLNPIDHVWQDKLKCIIPIPFIANQAQLESNINKGNENVFPKRIRRTNNILIEYLKNNKIKIL